MRQITVTVEGQNVELLDVAIEICHHPGDFFKGLNIVNYKYRFSRPVITVSDSVTIIFIFSLLNQCQLFQYELP